MIPKPELEEQHKKKRIVFSKKYLNWEKEWSRVWFSDEKKFNINGPDGNCYYWRDLDNRDGKLYFKKNIHYRKSVMVWGSFCSDKKTN